MDIHDLYQPFLRYFRSRRMRHFQELFSANINTTILDVGGTGFNWSLLPISPRLTILNLPGQIEEADASVIADGRCLPFKDRAFDIVFSNSVIEHLGDSASQEAFAREIARVSLGYHVQTPNRLFPFEPHLLSLSFIICPRSGSCVLCAISLSWDGSPDLRQNIAESSSRRFDFWTTPRWLVCFRERRFTGSDSWGSPNP